MVPALLLRPCIEFPLDVTALHSAARDWCERAERIPLLFDLNPNVSGILQSVLLPRPQDFPERRAPPVPTEGVNIEDAIEHLFGAVERLVDEDPPGRVLRELPFLAEIIASLSVGEEELLVPEYQRPDILTQLELEERRGRPPNANTPNLAASLRDALPHGNASTNEFGLGSERAAQVSGQFGPALSRFALELGLGRGWRGGVPPSLARVRQELAGFDEEEMVRAATQLVRARQKLMRRLDDQIDPDRTTIARTLCPMLLMDNGVLARPFLTKNIWYGEPTGDAAERTAEDSKRLLNTARLLAEWMRSRTFLQTLYVACSGRTERLRFIASPAFDWLSYAKSRHLPLHLVHVTCSPDHPGHRMATAALPGAQLTEPVSTWLMGFANDPQDLVRRLLGPSALGFDEALHWAM